MLYRCLLIFSFYHGTLTGFSQTNKSNDSLIFKKATEAFALASKNSDSAMLLATDALNQAIAIDNKAAMANAYNSIGWIFMHKGRLDSSIINLQLAWQFYSSISDPLNVAKVDINLAEVYTRQNQISNAIQHLMQADSLCAAINNIPLQTDVKRQLGIVYRESGDSKRAAGYFIEAMDGFVKQGDYIRYVHTAVSLSILYRNMQMPDSSLALLGRCLKIAVEYSATPYQVAMIHENMGETLFESKKYSEALNHYSGAYKVFETINNKADLAYEALCVGKTLVKLNQFKEAELYLLRSYSINDSLKMINYQSEAAGELASLYKLTGNWQKAYSYLEKTMALKDSVGAAEQITKTNELKEKFETEKKEHENTLLKAQNQLADANNRRSKLLQYILLLLLAASVIIGWLLFNRFRIKRKLEQLVLRNRIARDLHDDIGSALSSIDISSRIALVKKDDTTVITEQLARIGQHARKTMDSMSDIVWSIDPKNDNIESMLMRMREFAAEMCEPLHIGLQFIVADGSDSISLDTDKRKNIFLVYKEAINNAIKYSGCTSLSVELSKNENNLAIKIADNGKGFDEQTIKKGNGLANMRARAGQINGKLDIRSKKEEGTTIQLVCPV